MAKAKKTAVKAPEAVQDAPELQDAFQDIQEPDAIPEGAEAPVDGAGEALEPAQRASFGSAERPPRQSPAAGVEGLLGCQDDPDPEPEAPIQYAVTADPGLNLREGPSKAAPVITELPRGIGVFPTGVTQGEWTEVSTGRLTGWVMRKFLEPLWPY